MIRHTNNRRAERTWGSFLFLLGVFTVFAAAGRHHGRGVFLVVALGGVAVVLISVALVVRTFLQKK